MKIRTRITLFFAVCCSLLGRNDVLSMPWAESIIAGLDTKPHEFKYIVAFENRIEYLCGGGLISEQFALTAAHCVIVDEITFRKFPLKIVAGINDLYSRYDTRVATQVIKIYVSVRYNHSIWDTNLIPLDDLAILKLQDKLLIFENPALAALDLPDKMENGEYPSYENVTGILAGFGYDYVEVRTDSHNVTKDYGMTSGHLHQGHIRVVKNDICTKAYETPISDERLCASMIDHSNRTAQGGCSGDSGSPLVYKNVVIGLLSSSAVGCNDNVAPSVYTRITPYVEMIRNAMNDITDGMRTATYEPIGVY